MVCLVASVPGPCSVCMPQVAPFSRLLCLLLLPDRIIYPENILGISGKEAAPRTATPGTLRPVTPAHSPPASVCGKGGEEVDS